MTYFNCDTEKDPAGEIMCLKGTPATTKVVYRWADEQAYVQENLCDTCAGDIRHGAETGELVLIWCVSLETAGLQFPEPTWPSDVTTSTMKEVYA